MGESWGGSPCGMLRHGRLASLVCQAVPGCAGTVLLAALSVQAFCPVLQQTVSSGPACCASLEQNDDGGDWVKARGGMQEDL